MHRCLLHAKTAGILKVGFNVFVGKVLGIHAFFIGAFDDLVINVGKVLDISHIVTAIAEIAAHHIKGHDGAGIAQMNIVVGGRAANVHFDLTFFYGNKLFFLVMQCIIHSDSHDFPSPFSIRFPGLPLWRSKRRWHRLQDR